MRGDRLLNGLTQLVPSHGGEQVQALVNGVRQAGERRALAEKLRAHGEHDIDRQVSLLRRFEQQLDERLRFVEGATGCTLHEAEQLLKLVNENQELGRRGQGG